MGALFDRIGLLQESSLDCVRFVPWGKRSRAYLFEGATQVTLSFPAFDDAEIRYTLNGSEPTQASPRYSRPLMINETLEIKALPFRNGVSIGYLSSAFYIKLLPDLPAPEVLLSSLQPLPADGCHGSVINRSWHGSQLCLRGKIYRHGIGIRSGCRVSFPLPYGVSKFVARVGIDDSGGPGPSVFTVSIDGRTVLSSPPMLRGYEPWRFNIDVPPGSLTMSINLSQEHKSGVLAEGDIVTAGFRKK
jgi:hypothetical protein